MRGIATRDLGDLSHSQLVRADELQKKTVREEKGISEKMAKLQESLADSSLVELSHQVGEMLRNGGGVEAAMEEEDNDRVASALQPKEEGLRDALRMADDLRLRTLKDVVGILNPIQAVHFLIAATELHLRVHEWGKKRDGGLRWETLMLRWETLVPKLLTRAEGFRVAHATRLETQQTGDGGYKPGDIG